MKPVVFVLPFMLMVPPAHALEQVPFPELDTPGFCAAYVSKMLDPTEKRTEETKCLVREQSWKEAAQPYWQYLKPKIQTYVVTQHLKEVRNQTYITVWQYVRMNVPSACIDSGDSVCQPAKK